jgi:hypothetical protein
MDPSVTQAAQDVGVVFISGKRLLQRKQLNDNHLPPQIPRFPLLSHARPSLFYPLPPVSAPPQYHSSIFTIYSNFKHHKAREREREMEISGGLLGKLGRHCYAVLCLGVLLVSVTIAHCVSAAEPTDPRERAAAGRRLRALRGGPLRPSQSS